jgi:hypothetical protein
MGGTLKRDQKRERVVILLRASTQDTGNDLLGL